MKNKKIEVFMINNAKESFKKLNEIVGNQIKEKKKNSFEIQLLNSIKQKISLIKRNPFYGNQIHKKLIPKKFNASNLWRIELNNFWRMLYTIKGNEIEIVCFILQICNHKEYNKLFGYKNK